MPDDTKLPTVQESPPEMSPIIALAKDPAMDVEKLKALVGMQNDIMARKAKEAFAADFVRMKPHLKKVENKHLNSQTKSKYAKLEEEKCMCQVPVPTKEEGKHETQ